MRSPRLAPLAVLTIALAACTGVVPGWTYAPAPTATPVASGAASSGPSAPASAAASAAASASASGSAPASAAASASALASASASASASSSAQPSASGSSSAGGPELKVTAENTAYKETTLTAPADTVFKIEFENEDAGVQHNVTIHEGSATGAELFRGELVTGVASKTYDIAALKAGTYAYVCIVHPTMIGTLTVQ
jgi:plastocyanin